MNIAEGLERFRGNYFLVTVYNVINIDIIILLLCHLGIRNVGLKQQFFSIKLHNMWLSIFNIYRFYPATGTRATFFDGVLWGRQRPRPGSCLDEIADQATCRQQMTTTRRSQVKDDFGI